MIWLIRLLPVWNWLKANPLLALCALLALYAAYERHQAAKWHDRAEACQTASQAAAEATKALRAAERKTYQDKANEADAKHAADLARVRDATDAYIRTHRVQPSRISAPVAIGQASDAGQPESVPALVIVGESDVRNAAEWQSYGVACHDFLISITEDGQ